MTHMRQTRTVPQLGFSIGSNYCKKVLQRWNTSYNADNPSIIVSTTALALARRGRWYHRHSRLFAIIADHGYRDPTPLQVGQGLLGVRDVAEVVELDLVRIRKREQRGD
jgi:hypothetical protein